MKKLFMTGLFLVMLASFALAQFNININVGDKKKEPAPQPKQPVTQKVETRVVMTEYETDMMDFYSVQPAVFTGMKQKGYAEDEMNTVLFISSQTKVHPDEVVRMRTNGMSFWDITMKLNMNTDVYQVPVKDSDRHGPPYGKAYGHHKDKKDKKDKKEKKHKKKKHDNDEDDDDKDASVQIKLSDNDVKELVYVKFTSAKLGMEPDEVIEHRKQGKSFKETKEKRKKKH